MLFLKFYTYPPVEYPYVMRNIHQKPLKFTVHEIVDCGINDLLKPPFRHSKEKIRKWFELKTTGWKVVPDIPDIDREFKLKSGKDNVEESKELLEYLYDPCDPAHMPVVQGYYHDPGSFKKYGEWLIKIFGMPDKIGIGTMCKAGDKAKVQETVSVLRLLFPEAHIHAFGLRLQHLNAIDTLIDSWDSMSWTFPRGRGKASCKNKIERIQYFHDYLVAAKKYKTNLTSIVKLCA